MEPRWGCNTLLELENRVNARVCCGENTLSLFLCSVIVECFALLFSLRRLHENFAWRRWKAGRENCAFLQPSTLRFYFLFFFPLWAVVLLLLVEMADEGGPYEDGDSPPSRYRGDYYGVQSGFDGYADRENGDRKREVPNKYSVLFCCLLVCLFFFFVFFWLWFVVLLCDVCTRVFLLVSSGVYEWNRHALFFSLGDVPGLSLLNRRPSLP